LSPFEASVETTVDGSLGFPFDTTNWIVK